jgi:energy-coupling factor transporter transmembrane protein EcfT
MRKLHLIFGIFALIAFLLTGQYMDKYYNHMVGVPDGIRLLYRTRHIFILLAGLLNLGIAAYFTYRLQPWRRVLQVIGSVLIFVASLLFIAAFFYEPKLSNLYTPLSHWGTYTIVAGIALHLVSSIGQKKEATAS